MSAPDRKTITGKLLAQAIEENDQVISKNNLTPAELAILRGQSVIYLFIDTDHARVEEMYKVYDRWKWVFSAVAVIAIPVFTAGVILFLTQAYYFWADIVPKIKALP